MKKIIVIALALCALGCNETNNNSTNNQQSCGDQFAEGDETCDGLDLAGQTCESQGYSGGTLVCASTCLRFVTSGCTGQLACGNNAIDDGEECDGTELNGASCETVLTGTSGTLACGDCAFDTRGCHVDPLKIYQSGTRMKMRIGTSPDGSRDFQGWYDVALGLNCKFRRMTDGISRCIPEPTAQQVRFFADSACTVRLAAFPSEDAPLANGTRISMEIMTGTYEAFSIISQRSTELYVNAYGTCQLIQLAQTTARNDLYNVSLVPNGSFVEQVESIE